ncbi:uncharacterized protein C227.15 [Aspergillus awamori]|uniref:Uncharacterized protein C227.15 n=1 Tax=Aspergillus awamori TaxID=105351 RepID=A0A401KXJ6_ASPAW|nr:uncharacterized protein C227.15 [Aspergillus awamori]GKZ52315.1 hypothetical protein AnigIFM49718_000190 [Aspergillus niger]GKZ65861.1 hypothetical protein AnigIFM50267_010218 [Aspergillus niger]GLA07728.1 hypothetical protein AnigIFM60653_008967 [Aspergillus niger]GLA13241.1 hypothetical protein AnigIFM62618_010227 [Aspergillus niger]
MTAILPASNEGRSRFSPDPLRSPITQTYFLEEPNVATAKFNLPAYHRKDRSDAVVSSPSRSESPSPDFTITAVENLPPTPASLSSLSLMSEDHDDDELVLPSYDSSQFAQKEPEALSDVSVDSSADFARLTQAPAADDSTIEDEPSRHVDYLSHEWRQEDIWASWRYVVARRNVYDNGTRLENASWRTWAKLKLNLGTVSPEALNWLKDCDVTWLYGPLKTCSKREKAFNGSPPPSRLETPTLYPDRKPILKKRTASETILQRSLSQHTLLQHAGAILKAQEAEINRNRPPLQRASSEFGHLLSKSSTTPVGGTVKGTATNTSTSATPSERRHIHFNNEVVQCIAVEAKEEDDGWPVHFGDESSEDGIVMMKHIHSDSSLSDKGTPRGSLAGENKTIAPLPSTTLKYRWDASDHPDLQDCRGDARANRQSTSESPASSIMGRWSSYFSNSTPPTSSGAEKSTRTNGRSGRNIAPSANFLLDEEENDMEFDWEPSRNSYGLGSLSRPWFVNPEDDEELDYYFHSMSPGGMTPNEEDDEPLSASIFDRVADTVNTAKDIAHVIWNVGWRR